MLGALSAAACAFVLANQQPPDESRPLNAWLRDLSARESYRRNRAEAAVRQLGAGVVPVLLARLESTRTNEQAQAILGFAALGDRAKPALPQLAKLLHHEATALSAARAVAAIGPPGVPLLTNALAGPIRSVRIACARALGRLRADARPVVPALVGVLDDNDERLRCFAARSLGHLAAEPVQAVPALIARLEDPNADVRQSAAHSLGLFHGRASVAVPALVKALDDRDLSVKLTAAFALREINPALGQMKLK